MSLKKWKLGVTAQNLKKSDRLPVLRSDLTFYLQRQLIEYKIVFT